MYTTWVFSHSASVMPAHDSIIADQRPMTTCSPLSLLWSPTISSLDHPMKVLEWVTYAQMCSYILSTVPEATSREAGPVLQAELRPEGNPFSPIWSHWAGHLWRFSCFDWHRNMPCPLPAASKNYPAARSCLEDVVLLAPGKEISPFAFTAVEQKPTAWVWIDTFPALRIPSGCSTHKS